MYVNTLMHITHVIYLSIPFPLLTNGMHMVAVLMINSALVVW